MRFKCLVMDHDDTTVNSTATIHFPSFLAYLKLVRPEASYTLEEYFRKNFDPGIMALFTGELGFSEEELEGEFRFWQDWVRTRIPVAYPGIREILQRHKEAGGRIAVVSNATTGKTICRSPTSSSAGSSRPSSASRIHGRWSRLWSASALRRRNFLSLTI